MNKVIWEDMDELYSRNIKWSDLSNNCVMVTGAYGMLASYAVFMLIYLNEKHNANIQILALGRNKEKAKSRFKGYCNRPYFNFIKSDLRHLPKLTVKPDYIIHAASPASSQYYGVCPVDTTIPNVLGTYSLLDYASQNQVKSILFISSGDVYGKPVTEVICEYSIGLSDPLSLRYCYGESKRMGECLCNCYFHQYGVPVKIVRLGHTYGPTMDIDNDKRVFSEFVNNAVHHQNICVKSDGSGVRVFCYAADAVAGFFRILLSGNNGEAYNLFNNNGRVSVKELANIIVSCVPERSLKVIFSERSSNEQYIESDLIKGKSYVYDTSKLDALGWNCKYSVKEGFYRTITSFGEA